MIQKVKANIFLIIAIILAAVIILGALYFSNNKASTDSVVEKKYQEEEIEENANNVFITNGKQIVEIRAKGGFHPVHSIARAGVRTVLRIDTNGTLDCSSIVRIPSLNLSQNLPISGTTDIDIGVHQIGKLYGTCGLGNYPFDIKFE